MTPEAGCSERVLLPLFILASLELLTLGCLNHADITAGSSGAPTGQPPIQTRDCLADATEDVHRKEASGERSVAWASVPE